MITRLLGPALIMALFISCQDQIDPLYLKYDQLIDPQNKNEDWVSPMQSLCDEKLAAACIAVAPKDFHFKRKLSVLQGVTNDKQTQLNILLPKKLKKQLRAHLWEGPNLKKKNIKPTSWYGQKSSDFIVAVIHLSDLSVDHRYRIDFVIEKGNLLDSRFFSTLPQRKDKVRLAVASCMDDTYEVQEQMWRELIEQDPEMIFLIGDNVYADRYIGESPFASPQDLWRRYTQTRQTLYLFKTPKLIPIYATWDDHDYGINDGGKDYLYSEESAAIFKSFFSVEEDKWYQRGPGVSSFFHYAGQNFIFFDSRSFRDDNKNAQGEHLGVEQKKWFRKIIQNNKRPTWLIKGDQFFGSYHPFESFEGNHPNSFSQFLTTLKELEVGFIFLSGDRHVTEIMELPKKILGHASYELTTSPIHAKVFPDSFKKHPNPRQLVGADGVYNYMIINTQNSNNGLRFRAQSFAPSKKLLFDKELNVSL